MIEIIESSILCYGLFIGFDLWDIYSDIERNEIADELAKQGSSMVFCEPEP